MPGHHALLISNQLEARVFLNEIGVDSTEIEGIIPKAVFRCIKLKKISCEAAAIIQQEMVAQGGAAAWAQASLNSDGTTDILLMGTIAQYRLLIARLGLMPLEIRNLCSEIELILKNLESPPMKLKLAHNKELELGSRTLIMGILNITPDSFSDGGRYLNEDLAVRHALQMVNDGADIIDVGGASSRPNSAMAPAGEEIIRILPVIKRLKKEGLIISVDTFRAQVAREALLAGADIINDIGNLQLDAELINVLSEFRAPCILMHNRMQMRAGEPYEDLIADIIQELKQSISRAVNAGLGKDQLVIDPGIGFGKSLAGNLMLIKHLGNFKSLGQPVLVGTSRKSFIGQTLGLDVADRLEGSLATVVMAIMNGADIIRVHDVKASKRAAQMTDAVISAHG
ncbi:MAG: dihydropteroate synthase [Syntrophomonadaceae bacterium]